MEIQLNLDKICRLCLEEKCEQLQDVFGNESNLCENILRATAVKVQQGDGLPAHVCQQCVSLVNMIINFQRKCVVADLALHHYVRKCICHKEHKECEAVKFYPRDPLRLTQIIKTEGGPCQIKSETSVFQLQESREEVITGIIEEGSSNPRVSIKPEVSESSIRTSKTFKGKQINGRCISVNVNRGQSTTVNVHKRRKRKGHRWKIKKQSSANRRRALGIHLQNTESLQNTETFTTEASILSQKIPQTGNSLPTNKKVIMDKSGQNTIVSPTSRSLTAAEEGLPNVMSSNTLTINKRTATRGHVLKTRKSRSSNSVVLSKNLLLKEAVQKRTVSLSRDTVMVSKHPAEESPQNKRIAQNNNTITVNRKTAEENPQNKKASQNSNTITANKKAAPKECQQNTRASDTSKTFLAKESTSNQSSVLANQKLVPIRTRNSFSRKLVTQESAQNSNPIDNQKLEMDVNIQMQRMSTNLLKKTQPMQSCNSVPANQKQGGDEHVGNSSNKIPTTTEESTSNQKLPQNSKSISTNQKLVAAEQIQTRKSLLKEQDPTPSINSPVDHKLVAEPHVRIQKVLSSRNSFINKPITEDSPLNESSESVSSNQKLVLKQHVQTRRTSLRGKSVTEECLQTEASPETVHNGALLPGSETFQADKLAAEKEDCGDTLPANGKCLQNASDNTVPTKRKTPETESSVPEPLSTKKQKTKQNDRLTKLVIQVEGNKLCCSQCDSWFEDVEELKRHLEEVHNKRVIRWHTVMGPGPEKDALPPSLLCASCGKQFTSQRLFTLHQNQKSCS